MHDVHPDTHARDAPIYKLHDDILLHIFKINGNMEDDDQHVFDLTEKRKKIRAIETTLNSSQVSVQWRNLIVNSPLLWADLIDIYILHFSGHQWRKEVLRRTKGCALHVRGVLDLKHIDAEWWRDFFNDHWQRIRIFDVELYYLERPPSLIDARYRTWITYRFRFDPNVAQIAFRFLSWPTTTLEHFRLQFPLRLPDVIEPSFSLFDGHAPRLRFLQISNAPAHIPLLKQHDSFAEIESLYIKGPDTRPFSSARILLEVISRLPRLQSLRIQDAMDFDPPDVSSDPISQRVPIHLPLLTKIAISSSNRNRTSAWRTRPPYWHILDSIIPNDGCSIQVNLPLKSSVDEDLPSFSRYIENYFTSRSPDKLMLMTKRESFFLSGSRNTSIAHPGSNLDLAIGFSHYSMSPTVRQERVYQLFKATFFLSFPTVTSLQLDVFPSQESPFADRQFGRLLSSLSSVESLYTTARTLLSLYTSPVINISTLFPRLTHLTMPLQTRHEANTLVRLLKLRKKAGLPISSFEYRPLKYDIEVMDLKFLDSFVGLKVLWAKEYGKMGQYVCGSGQPERLDFKNKKREGFR